MDCLLTKTILIYWGCPNISEYFDTTGWIILETETVEELHEKGRELTPDYYHNYTEILLIKIVKRQRHISISQTI
jgi:hypothetical protein